jgi:DNA-binding transcriptional ArsR family regulator
MNSSSRNQQQTSASGTSGWDFLTNHAHVLTCVADDPGIRLRDIAAAVGITERAAHRILSELVEAGYVLRERDGRRNRYQVVPDLPLRHPLVQGREVGDLLRVLLGSARTATARSG